MRLRYTSCKVKENASMPLTDAQRSKLRKYVRKEDRGREPVFVGRGDLFKLVRDNADAVADGDVEGRTVCIAGPPGIGKTAFLSKLHEMSADPNGRAKDLLALRIPAIAFSRKNELLDKISRAIPPVWGPPKGVVPRMLDAVGAEQIWRVARRRERNPQDIDAGGFPWDDMPRMLENVPPDVVVCLLVDEAHGVQPTAGVREGVERNYAVGGLHEGPPPHLPTAGRRVFGLFAGHTHTREVLEKSISGRFASGNMQYMQGLSDTESLRYVQGTLDHFEVPGGDPGRTALAEWIADECGGFPHHLRNAMSAIADGLLDADSLALSDLDGASFRKSLRRARVEYYEARTENAIGQIRKDLGDVLQRWSNRADPVEVSAGMDDLDELIDDLGERRRARLADDYGIRSGAGLMREMVGKGVAMTDSEGGGCRCPIDSLAAWMKTGIHSFRQPFPRLAEGRKPRNSWGSPSP